MVYHACEYILPGTYHACVLYLYHMDTTECPLKKPTSMVSYSKLFSRDLHYDKNTKVKLFRQHFFYCTNSLEASPKHENKNDEIFILL